jgi:hypothetical protein
LVQVALVCAQLLKLAHMQKLLLSQSYSLLVRTLVPLKVEWQQL